MATYFELTDQLSALASLAESRGRSFNRDVVGEALDSLRDLSRLEDRVRATMSQLVLLDQEQSHLLISMLRGAAQSDPKLAEWLASNPNPKMAGLSFGATADSEELFGSKKHRELLQDLRIDAHAWYHRAHRLIKVLCTIDALRSFECRQVTIVRNHLLEHPEGKNSGVTHASHGYDHLKGPVVKALRIGKQAGRHVDDGMYAASESLRAALQRAIGEAKTHLELNA